MLKNLPTCYEDINYKTYVEIMNRLPNERPEGVDSIEWSRTINLGYLSVLLGISEADVEALKHKKVAEMINAVNFLNTPMKQQKTHLKVKRPEDLTYDDFSTYQRLRLDQWNNLGNILSLVLIDVTPEQIDKMNIQEVMNVFFCLSISTHKYFSRLRFFLIRRLIKQVTIKILTPWRILKIFKKKNFMSAGAGSI